MRTRKEHYANPGGKGQLTTFTPELIGENGRIDKRLEDECRRIAAEGIGKLIVPFHDPARGIKRAAQ